MPHEVPIDGVLDLHCFSPRDIASVVEEYIWTASATNLPVLRIIHGRGIGVQRRTVQMVLRRHPAVMSFWDAPESHLGATVVQLLTGTRNRLPEP